MTGFDDIGFVMSILAVAGIAVMADRPLEARCERILEWLRAKQ